MTSTFLNHYFAFGMCLDCGARQADVPHAQPCPARVMRPVLYEVATERARQDARWGEQNHPNGTGPDRHPLRDFREANLDFRTATTLAITAKKARDRKHHEGRVTHADVLLEEVFEALAEDDPASLRAKLVQVVAVAVQWVEKIDRDGAAQG